MDSNFRLSYEMESSPCWMAMLYDDISTEDSECSRNFQASADITSPSSFYRDELDRALSEQSFGLIRYEVTSQCVAQEASSVVTLLEGTVIRVHLDIRGYRADEGETHESIDELLRSISPMYEQKKEDRLIRKLQGLQ